MGTFCSYNSYFWKVQWGSLNHELKNMNNSYYQQISINKPKKIGTLGTIFWRHA